MKIDIKPRSLLTTLAELAGFAAITVGAWDIYHPAGWITGGACLVAAGVLAA